MINPEQVTVFVWYNRLQSALLLVMLAAFMAAAGYLIGGEDVAWGALWGAVLSWFLAPWVSPALVLRMFRAQPLYPDEAPQLYRTLAALASRAGLPQPPTLYVMPATILNAFAVGEGRKSAIVLSAGLLHTLDQEQLAGVLAHELAHVRNRDTRLMGFADVLSRMTHVLSAMGVLALFINLPLYALGMAHLPWLAVLFLTLGPTAVDLAQLALSRTREFQADAVAAWLLGTPVPLIRALQALEAHSGLFWERLWMSRRRLNEPSVLRTHPPTGERIARLRALQDQAGFVQRYPL
ncbi:zinc metalloprotease HtpX [Hahella sp. SMD15-11]|uniref:Zinc metalloprotease HtpX n=1 Tax=Thermohahella caldifontis TaxID=3142973 RepID=A0AB39UYS2_9GAMM